MVIAQHGNTLSRCVLVIVVGMEHVVVRLDSRSYVFINSPGLGSTDVTDIPNTDGLYTI